MSIKSCAKFFEVCPEYVKIVWDSTEVTVYREGSTEPFGIREFRLGTRTYKALANLEGALKNEKPFVTTN